MKEEIKGYINAMLVVSKNRTNFDYTVALKEMLRFLETLQEPKQLNPKQMDAKLIEENKFLKEKLLELMVITEDYAKKLQSIDDILSED